MRDDFEKQRIVEDFGAKCCRWKGAAITQVAWANGVPAAIVRAISDKADGSSSIDYPTFEAQAARNSAALVISMPRTARVAGNPLHGQLDELPTIRRRQLVRDERGLALVGDGMELRCDLARMLPRIKPGKLQHELLVKAAKVRAQPRRAPSMLPGRVWRGRAAASGRRVRRAAI